ncbi:MAG: S49 family peptidase [Pseudomonadota bacterium]
MGSIDRVMAGFLATPWFMHEGKAREILAVLEWRAETGQGKPYDVEAQPEPERRGRIAVIPLVGTILPRSALVGQMSPSPSIEDFMKSFRAAAQDPDVKAIVLDIDSPGGRVDKVPEAAAEIGAARRPDRPIVAIANTLAASAAYYIAVSADEVVVTPSGEVGSIGVIAMHQDLSEALKAKGVSVTIVQQGARKSEGNPFGPLDEEALRHFEAMTAHTYDGFVAHVAAHRGVDDTVVRADPESGKPHMGGGRCYHASDAVALGMADRIETFEQTLQRLSAEISERQRRRDVMS